MRAALATAEAAAVQQPLSPPTPPWSSVSARLAEGGYVVLPGYCSAQLRLRALRVACGVDWLLPERWGVQ